MSIISDNLSHDTGSVHEHLKPVLTYLKSLNPTRKRVNYFTDGSVAQ
jgi:hypothetical protein